MFIKSLKLCANSDSGNKEADICGGIINRVRNTEFYFKRTGDNEEKKNAIMCLESDFG